MWLKIKSSLKFMNVSTLIYFIFAYWLINLTNAQTINLIVQASNSSTGPENMGIGMGHSSLNGNWVKFIRRLGVNSARYFLTPIQNIRSFIGTKKFGQDLNGLRVTSLSQFYDSISTLRSSNGRNFTYPWANPIDWSTLFQKISTVNQPIFGSSENTINKLNSINLNSILLVENIDCSMFPFQSMNLSSSTYWSERWELYKYSYALAIYARLKQVKMIEFYNEPDLDLGGCLKAEHFKDYFLIRSISIQNAYYDFNNDPIANINQVVVNVQVLASAFAKLTYKNDPTSYLGPLVAQNNNYIFGSLLKSPKWSNMQLYSYHSYGKPGFVMLRDYLFVSESIQKDINYSIPVVITEHNCHTAASWNTINSTPDSVYEASRLASQIINLIIGQISSHYVFKFSVTPTTDFGMNFKLNGLHWAEIDNDPFHVSDTTLSAEAFRMLTSMKKSQIFSIISNDNTINNSRTYLSSISNNQLYYFVYLVNDDLSSVGISIDLNQWSNMLDSNTKAIIEQVGNGSWGEITSLQTIKSSFVLQNITLNSYSTMKLTIPIGRQSSITTKAFFSCSPRAGLYSNSQIDCSNQGVYIGTSNTLQHDATYVTLIQFYTISSLGSKGKSILSINFEQLLGNLNSDNMTIQILGLNNFSSSLISQLNTLSWNSLTNISDSNGILIQLNSGTLIDSISKNFINWSSLYDLTLVGHITITSSTRGNTRKMIDVSDYVNRAINNGQTYLTFMLYRPFRHPSYATKYGSIPSDDLSNGALLKFSSSSSLKPPHLLQYAKIN